MLALLAACLILATLRVGSLSAARSRGTAPAAALAQSSAAPTPSEPAADAGGAEAAALAAGLTVPGDNAVGLQDFDLVTARSGWLLLRQRLFWTDDAGRTWQDITPPGPPAAAIQAVAFADARAGWLVLIEPADDGFPRYHLARTDDAGRTWRLSQPALFDPGEVESLASAVYLDLLDAQTGWLVVRQATSRNFSLGTLFHTTDGGETWVRRALPMGEPVSFVTRDLGWTAGGVTGEELYRTEDGGQTWQPQAVSAAGAPRRYYLPRFESPTRGVLPVVAPNGAETTVEFYTTADGGQSWQPAAVVPAGRELAPGTHLPLSVLDARRWLLLLPDRGQLTGSFDGGATLASISQAALAAGITRLDLVTPEQGWALYANGQCAAKVTPGVPAGPPPADCTLQVRLLRTADGGRTWQVLPLPAAGTAPSAGSEPALTTETYYGHGFDSCTRPSLDQMLTWSTQSPYRAWNVYIGGSSRANCGNFSESFLESLAGQGWKLIPTWVGPQASCSNFRTRMSGDPAVAYDQGVAEANAAMNTASALGLTPPDTTDAIIYYDLEAYPVSNAGCRAAARAFISGWTAQLHSRGSQSGVYGSTCGSALYDFAQISNGPDAIWAAVWIQPYQYRSDVSLFNLPCLDNSLWSNGTRLRQYSGGHDEYWGGVTINIDSNALGGLVAYVPNPCPQADGVTLFWNAGYDCGNGSGDLGYRQRTVPGWQNLDGSFNENASSLRVPPGWSVRLYRDPNRAGPSVCYSTDIPDFASQWTFPGTFSLLNDSVSSIEVFNNGNCALPLPSPTPQPTVPTPTAQPAPPASDWQQTFYANTSFGSQCGTRTESSVYFFRDSEAGWALPDGCPGTTSAWSARFSRSEAWFDGGTYEFFLASDDGARLFVDNVLVIDGWNGGQQVVARDVSGGNHELRLEFRNSGGRAVVQLAWRGPGALPASQTRDPRQWWVSYWGNRTQWGAAVASRNEGTGFLEHGWSNDGPGFGLPDEQFSTRYERTFSFVCGTYSFRLASDDGSRLAIDGLDQAAFDNWEVGIWDTTAQVTLSEGDHTIRVDHFENTGGAGLFLYWSRVAPCPASPTPSRTPTHLPLGNLPLRLYFPLIAN